MTGRTVEKGMGWGHGLSLLAVLVAAGLMMVLYAKSIEGLAPTTGPADNVARQIEKVLEDVQDAGCARHEAMQRMLDPPAGPLFDLVLKDPGDNEQEVVEAVMAIADVSRDRATDLVNSCPMAVRAAISPAQANRAKKTLEAVGAGVEIRPTESKEP